MTKNYIDKIVKLIVNDQVPPGIFLMIYIHYQQITMPVIIYGKIAQMGSSIA